MSEMVERVAKAIWDSPLFFGLITDEKRRDGSWHDCTALARAAIEAMREPTDEMVLASEAIDAVYPSEHWRAMIDAALK